MSQMIKTSLTVNGKRQTVTAQPDTPLLWVLREDLKLTGTKFGCGAGQCGACMVHVDGKSVFSCLLPVSQMGGRRTGAAMRLLPIRADHARGRSAEVESASDARTDRRAHEHQHLPLRDVRADCEGG
jgi:isoquinoline 1-oxidoreductase alpha subunit